jgi:hypothetical protein
MVLLIWDPGRPIPGKGASWQTRVSGAHTPVLGFEQDPWLSRTKKDTMTCTRPRGLDDYVPCSRAYLTRERPGERLFPASRALT